MSLFPNHRDANDSIGYTAVNNEHTHDGTGRSSETNFLNDGVPTSRSRAASSTHDDGFSYNQNDKSANFSVQQIGAFSNGQEPNGHNGPQISGWPTAPRKLSNFSISLFIGDILLILLPIAFIVLGVFAWRLDGQSFSETGAIVQRAMSLGPTIYPLAFAAIGSRCLRNVAVYLAERGTTLSTLEKLLGSQSLVSAIGTAVSLRSYSLLSLAVLLLWTLSPLGGQSSLRLLHQANTTITENGTVYYADHDAPMYVDELGPWMNIVPAVLSASVITSPEIKNLPVDIWDHPKIPRIDAIEQLAQQDVRVKGDWIDVNTTAKQTYSSWAGVNVQNLRPVGSTKFQVKYNYMFVNCEVLFSDDTEKVRLDMLAANLTMYPPVPVEKSNTSHTTMKELNGINYGLSMSFQIAHSSNATNKFRNDTALGGFEMNNQPITYLYGASFKKSQTENETYVHQVYTCTPHAVTLDAHIHCEAGNCIADRLRYLPGPDKSTLLDSCSTYKLNCLMTGTQAPFGLMHWMPRSLGSVMGYGLNGFDDWIAGNDVTFRGFIDRSLDKIRFADEIADSLVSERLTIIFNTFYQAVAWGRQVSRAGRFEVPDYNIESIDGLFSPEAYINTTEATYSHVVPVYKAASGWIASLLLITILLLLLGIFNLAVAFLTVAPDLFYYASSLARENPYTNTPDGGTVLGGAERSRLLREMKVQIADASPENQVGYVVLKSVGNDEDFKTGRLRKDKLYW